MTPSSSSPPISSGYFNSDTFDTLGPSAIPRRHSQPPLPIPGLGLRAALLGYLGEVEASIRERLGGATTQEVGLGDGLRSDESSTSEGHSTDREIDSPDNDTPFFGLDQDGDGLRYRGRQQSSIPGPSIPMSTTIPALSLETPRAYSSQDALLSHLSWLREDILASLPPAVLSAPSSSREWLRALPHRLLTIERGLWSEIPDLIHDKNVDGILPQGAVESARLKVLEIVRGVLPTDEWEGWERLGWEENDTFSPVVQTRPRLRGQGKRRGMGTGEMDDDEDDDDDGDEEEEDEEESNLLFPNRTPAAAKAIESKRRTIRSKSLGAAGKPGSWAALQGGIGYTGNTEEEPWSSLPRLQRMRTMPNFPADRDTVLDPEDSDDVIQAIGGITSSPKTAIIQSADLADDILGGSVKTASPMGKGKGKLRSYEVLGPSIAEALVASDDGRRLMKYENLPVDWRNNEHIVTGYRFIPLHAKTGPIPLLKSAFQWHNETINIHTHFIPTIIILMIIPFMIHTTPLPDAHPLDTAVLVLYLIAAISCLFTSAEWHVLSGCASKKWMEWGACVDYVGISWLIAASFGTVVYNAFYCQPKAVLLYCSTNAACGALGSYLPFQKWFNQRRMKPYRIAFFLTLNCAMFAPMLQLYYKYGWEKGSAFTSHFLPSISMYVFGLLFYAFHFPECVFPGKFDRILHSHQIWHTGIVIAIILHYRAVFAVHDMRLDYSCAAPGAGSPVSVVVARWLKGISG